MLRDFMYAYVFYHYFNKVFKMCVRVRVSSNHLGSCIILILNFRENVLLHIKIYYCVFIL